MRTKSRTLLDTLERRLLPRRPVHPDPWGPVALVYAFFLGPLFLVGQIAWRLGSESRIQNPGPLISSSLLAALFLGLLFTNRRGHFKLAAWTGLIAGSAYAASAAYWGSPAEASLAALVLVTVTGMTLGPVAGLAGLAAVVAAALLLNGAPSDSVLPRVPSLEHPPRHLVPMLGYGFYLLAVIGGVCRRLRMEESRHASASRPLMFRLVRIKSGMTVRSKAASRAEIHWSPAGGGVPDEPVTAEQRRSTLREKMGMAWQEETPGKFEALRLAMRDHQWHMVALWAQTLKLSASYFQLLEIETLCAEVKALAESVQDGMHTNKVPIVEKVAALDAALQATFRLNPAFLKPVRRWGSRGRPDPAKRAAEPQAEAGGGRATPA